MNCQLQSCIYYASTGCRNEYPACYEPIVVNWCYYEEKKIEEREKE